MSTPGRGRVVDPLNKATAVVISDILDEIGMTHPQLSDKAGIPRSTLSKLLAGTSAMDLSQLSRIASVLNHNVFELISLAESRLSATPLSQPADNLVRFPTLDSTPVLNPEPEFTPEIAQRSAAKTPHHYQDGYTTEHGLNYDDLGEENQDPQDREQ